MGNFCVTVPRRYLSSAVLQRLNLRDPTTQYQPIIQPIQQHSNLQIPHQPSNLHISHQPSTHHTIQLSPIPLPNQVNPEIAYLRQQNKQLETKLKTLEASIGQIQVMRSSVQSILNLLQKQLQPTKLKSSPTTSKTPPPPYITVFAKRPNPVKVT